MEMTYNGTLTMPANFAALDAEEMTYVEGGWIGSCMYSSGYSAKNACNNLAADLWKIAGCIFLASGWATYAAAAVSGALGSTIPGAGTTVGAVLGYVFGGITVAVAEAVIINWAMEWGRAANACERRGWQITTVEVALNSLVMEVSVH